MDDEKMDREVAFYIRQAALRYDSSYLNDKKLMEEVINSISYNAKKKIISGKLEARDDWVRGVVLTEGLEQSGLNPVDIRKNFDKEKLNKYLIDIFENPERLKAIYLRYDELSNVVTDDTK